MAFFQRAFVAALLCGAAGAVAGVWIVLLRIAFLGLLISHAAFAGALFGLLVRAPAPVCALLFSLGAAAAIGPLSDRSHLGPDTALGILFSLSLGLAFLFLGLLPGPRGDAFTLLWGNILTVTGSDLAMLAATTLLTMAVAVLFSKEIHAIVFSRELADACGIPTTPVYYGMLLICGAVTAACLKAVGGLLVASLLVNPAAAACRLSRHLKTIYGLSVLFSIGATVGGLFASAALNLPTGACIALTSCLLFCGAAVIPARGFHGRRQKKVF